MKNLKSYTKSIGLGLVLFFISNPSSAAITDTNQSGGFSNETIFFVLVALAAVLLVGIFFLTNSIKDLMQSDFYKTKMYEEEEKRRKGIDKNVITTLLFLVGIPFASLSLSPAPIETAAQVDDFPLYWVWMMVIIDIILLVAVFYIRNLFFQILRTVKPLKTATENSEEAKSKEVSKITQMLTDIVPIEKEHEIMMDHEYDGIYELDNNLPPWWVWSFYVCIAFSIIYIFNYHVIGSGDLQLAEYKKEMERGEKEVADYLISQKLNVDESSVILLTEASDLSKGKALFDEKCIVCHGKQGEGVIGPNLTDDYWLHGGDIKSVFKLIKYGKPEKSMQAWKDELNPVEMQQVASFIKSIKGTAVGIGKEPEGSLYEENEVSKTVSDSTANEDRDTATAQI